MNNSITPKLLNDFVAIDVEYANREQDICQIGLVVVRNLEIVNSVYGLYNHSIITTMRTLVVPIT